MTIVIEKIERLKVGDTDVFLEDCGPNRGKITISDVWGHNYSYFWGAMGGTIRQFLISINKEYFASKLMGAKVESVVDARKTFAGIRKHFRVELDLPWYKHQVFQADMREKLKSFQSQIEERPDPESFVDRFYLFINCLSFHLIDDSFDMKRLERDFKDIDEPWHFIEYGPHPEYKWLLEFHGKLKEVLSKTKEEQS